MGKPYKTTILCSYVTLGVYIPALLLYRKLKEDGKDCELIALEQLFYETKLNDIPKLKKAYHDNFKFAKTASRMAAHTNADSLDEEKVSQLFHQWDHDTPGHFISFSGYWGNILDRYLSTKQNHDDILVDLVHLDIAPPPSWKSFTQQYGQIRTIKLFDDGNDGISCYIPPSASEFPENLSSSNKILVHGGGWGIGTYRERAKEMIDHQLQLGIVAYETADMQATSSGVDYHLLDPDWKPYNGKTFTFPSFKPGEQGNKGLNEMMVSVDTEYYPYFNLVLESLAIVSKPGGGTLNDSISAGVPIVFLDAFGEHELANSAKWKKLGFGIDFEDWRKTGFSIDLLKDFKNNLQQAKKHLSTLYEIL